MTQMPSCPPYSELELHPEFSHPVAEGVLTQEEALHLWACQLGGWQLSNLLSDPLTRLATLSLLAWEPGRSLFRQ